MNETKGSQRRAQLGVLSQSVFIFTRGSASPLLFTPVSVREAQVPSMWTVCRTGCHVVCFRVLYWERGLTHSVSHFFFSGLDTDGCAVWMCVNMHFPSLPRFIY